MKQLLILTVFMFVGLGGVYGDEPTSITSDRVEMEATDTQNIFKFFGNVELKSDDFNATCEELEVISNKSESTSSGPEVSSMDAVEKILAKRDITMTHEGRTVTAGLATIYPQEGKVVLEDNPVVEDENGTVKGHRIVLYRGDRKAHVEGADGKRPTITLSNLPSVKEKKEGLK